MHASMTYKSRAIITEGGPHVCGLLEVVGEAQTKFGTDDAGPHEIGRDLLSADEPISAVNI